MTEKLFSMALGLQDPWVINKINFTPSESGNLRGKIDIIIDFKRGARFPDPDAIFQPPHITIIRDIIPSAPFRPA